MSILPITAPGLIVNGSAVTADFSQAVSDVTIDLALDAASTVTVTLIDPTRYILTSPVAAERSTVTVDDATFELASIHKSGDQLQLTFQDQTIAQLGRNTSLTPPAAAGTTDRYGYVRRVLAGTGVAVWTPPPGQKTLTVLAQGTSSAPAEDKWTCLTRLASDVQDRCYAYRGAVFFGPDSWIATLAPPVTLRENTNGVDSIDLDWDVGQPFSTATITLVASQWAVPPGTSLVLAGMGAASGSQWLVSQVSKSLYTASATVTATAPQKSLPEPSTSTG